MGVQGISSLKGHSVELKKVPGWKFTEGLKMFHVEFQGDLKGVSVDIRIEESFRQSSGKFKQGFEWSSMGI